MTHLKLYTTLGCHLCEQLEAELIRLGKADLELERIEIAGDEALLERYGSRIPVLADGGDELERGFEAERLAHWLESRGLLAEPVAPSETPSNVAIRWVKGRRFLG